MERHTEAVTECARSSTVAACKSMDSLLDPDEYITVATEGVPSEVFAE